VLAVYARPAATISFDLSPEQPLRASPAAAPAPPETLAPLTSDSTRRRAVPPRNADLSVVAASQFREVQRSSKRVVWISSLGSAAAASLLTFWLANNPAPTRGVAASHAEPLAALAPAAAAAPSLPSAAPVVSAAPSADAPAPAAAATEVAVAKPKPTVHKPRAVVAPAPKPPRSDVDGQTGPHDPGAEPNPYDVKLEDSPAPKAAPAAPAARGSGLEPDGKGSDASASSATTPGF